MQGYQNQVSSSDRGMTLTLIYEKEYRLQTFLCQLLSVMSQVAMDMIYIIYTYFRLNLIVSSF